MKTKLKLIAVLILFTSGRPIGAAEPKEELPDKRTMVAKTMMMTPAEEKKFWPLYDDYQIELNKLNSDRMAVLNKFVINYNRMSDELAKELLDQAMDIEKKRLNSKKNLITKFSKDFSPKFVARYFQLENKLDVMAMSAAAENVPLIKEKF